MLNPLVLKIITDQSPALIWPFLHNTLVAANNSALFLKEVMHRAKPVTVAFQCNVAVVSDTAGAAYADSIYDNN
jgi:hypothetical protein